MPRRVADYDPAFAALNLVSTIGAMLLAVSTLPFLINVVVSLQQGRRRRPEPVARLRPGVDDLVAAADPQLPDPARGGWRSYGYGERPVPVAS